MIEKTFCHVEGISENTDRCSKEIPQQYIIQDGDVLFSWSGSLEVVIWHDGEGALNQHLFKVSSDKYPKWFYYLSTKHHLPTFKSIAESKEFTKKDFFAFDVNSEKLNKFCSNLKIHACVSSIDLVKNSDVVILACKPQQMPALCSEISVHVSSNHLIISIIKRINIIIFTIFYVLTLFVMLFEFPIINRLYPVVTTSVNLDSFITFFCLLTFETKAYEWYGY